MPGLGQLPMVGQAVLVEGTDKQKTRDRAVDHAAHHPPAWRKPDARNADAWSGSEAMVRDRQYLTEPVGVVQAEQAQPAAGVPTPPAPAPGACARLRRRAGDSADAAAEPPTPWRANAAARAWQRCRRPRRCRPCHRAAPGAHRACARRTGPGPRRRRQVVTPWQLAARVAPQRGFTLMELVVTLALLGLLAMLAAPLAELAVQRSREQALREALREIRGALDRYKAAADRGLIERAAGDSGYPPNLQVLVDGVPNQKSPNDEKLYFLRRLPRDPFAADNGAERRADLGAARLRQRTGQPASRRRRVRCDHQRQRQRAERRALPGVVKR